MHLRFQLLAALLLLLPPSLLCQGVQTAGHQTLIELPDAVVQQAYSSQLQPPAGTPPWAWRVVSGNLPPGLTIESDGAIAGTPTEAGSFRLQVEATDSATTAQTVSYQLELTVQPELEVQWDAPPTVEPGDLQGTIQGRIKVTNRGRETVSLTVIVVAINEIGKAFALGYQHFDFAPGTQVIPFESTVPRGTYTVHADAIGQISATAVTLYSNLQTPQSLEVP